MRFCGFSLKYFDYKIQWKANQHCVFWYFNRFENSEVSLIRSGIAWESDKKLKFKNPAECTSSSSNNTMECLKTQFQRFAKPKDWKKNLWELDTSNPANNGLQNEDLILWMRPAAFSSFKKLYRKINHTDDNNLIFHSSGMFKIFSLSKNNFTSFLEVVETCIS